MAFDFGLQISWYWTQPPRCGSVSLGKAPHLYVHSLNPLAIGCQIVLVSANNNNSSSSSNSNNNNNNNNNKGLSKTVEKFSTPYLKQRFASADMRPISKKSTSRLLTVQSPCLSPRNDKGKRMDGGLCMSASVYACVWEYAWV